jgi:predicted dehydrogenase
MRESDAVRVGVVGVGYLGAHHASAYQDLSDAILVGVTDVDRGRAMRVAREAGCRYFAGLPELLGEVDAVSVAVPTTAHAAVTCEAMAAGVHVLVEKPIAASVEEAATMVAAAATGGLILQVGHLERFNPAFAAVRDSIRKPAFIESHRLSGFGSRGIDVPVVLDLMVHDLDLVLWAFGSDPDSVDAVGIPVLSDQEDIANARLGFPSGSVANLTVSRVSREKVRKIRFFQQDAYVSVDLLARAVTVVSKGSQGIVEVPVEVPAYDPLRRQLASFLHAVRTGRVPEVDGAAGLRVLRVAIAVMDAARARKKAIRRYWSIP